MVASHAIDPADLESDKKEAMEYLTEQYRKMLEDNLNDHIKNFEKYGSK